MLKIKKRKMHFWTPKRLFYTKLMKKVCLFTVAIIVKKATMEYVYV